jgi:DNA mismatch repair protein MutS
LKELENRILGAEERAKSLEMKLFAELREFSLGYTDKIQRTANALADIDAVASLAECARVNNYVRPHIFEDNRLVIHAGRHPVLDVTMDAGEFVPNDINLNRKAFPQRMMLITGPNMAGKSTYIRQNALLVIMAQMGSFIPAEYAEIGLVDRIFTRIGAGDDLARNQSTFMVEMVETSNILRNATERSFVILDEIGRGTSTYDGLSIAWSVAEYLHDDVKCRTLFATHYHELMDLKKSCPGIGNYNVAVKEHGDEIIFLRQIVPGSSDRSYGIHVARLAGVPDEVLDRAKSILEMLEKAPDSTRQVMFELPFKTAAKRRKKNSKKDDENTLTFNFDI